MNGDDVQVIFLFIFHKNFNYELCKIQIHMNAQKNNLPFMANAQVCGDFFSSFTKMHCLLSELIEFNKCYLGVEFGEDCILNWSDKIFIVYEKESDTIPIYRDILDSVPVMLIWF